ncbi:DUF1538 domain-containing protein [Chelativorans sp. AA-79]|uniref:DUF1538 domain-containing protein n=1 Tax=Chelativorans sp. AA-79 TaxID=3028735 RepID=UPI0023F84A40|nr:DUF1538 domain-containing protein [Chelativorans sp. AA-79]WEX12397.1 DUF1538 domain-containing protein [Chelativorans sp. AA-79]
MTETWLEELQSTIWSVAIAIVPLIVLFLLFQIFLLRLPRQQVADVLKGTAIAAFGLFLFLLGMGIGFLPFGLAVGEALGRLNATWLFVLIGLVLGFLTTWGEPAVRILAGEVEEASSGSIRGSLVLYAVCAGVALWTGIGMLRIAYGIPLLYLLIPGYLLVSGLMWFSDKDFVMIAVDSGGVATGPLANSFLLALALGASTALGGLEPVVQGFGFVALIALAPITSVMLLGFLIRMSRTREQEK